MTMIERVARAILAKVPVGYGMTYDEALDYARAAIEAMRKLEGAPLMAAYKAACRCGGAINTDEITKVWQDAIDAALNEQVAG